jgi:hypothetical protein
MPGGAICPIPRFRSKNGEPFVRDHAQGPRTPVSIRQSQRHIFGSGIIASTVITLALSTYSDK